MKLRQYELWNLEGRSMLVCWLKDDESLKVGTRLTLKETNGVVWKVLRRYLDVREHTSIPYAWRVGGLV